VPPTNQPLAAVLSAAVYVAEKHVNQRRKGQTSEPYINHLIEVAHLVADANPEPDVNLVIAALLHDAIEDVGVSKEEIANRFGDDVAELVAEVTDDKSLPKKERKRLQVENAPKKSARAQVIKLADKISNVQAMISSPPADWDSQRRKEYVEWAARVVAGLSAPNPALKQKFESLVEQFDHRP
jgi:(p)ppGpp synthase/HD superfamily hydrolase